MEHDDSGLATANAVPSERRHKVLCTGSTKTPEVLEREASKPFYRGAATERFFSLVCDEIGQFDGCFVVVAHMLPTLPPFLQALERVGRVAGIVPKPSSVDPTVLDWARRRGHAILELSRRQTDRSELVAEQLGRVVGSERFILLDIGGYFASSLAHLRGAYPDQLIGLVEDTENGHQRYQASSGPPVPCVSVARSLSKRNEDRWVGQAVVYSAEALLREAGSTLDLKRALVLGFGKIGQSVAHTLRRRGLAVTVWDTDPSQRVYARCENFRVDGKVIALRGADLIFCATGNKSLRGEDFRALKGGSVVFSVTSSDDEFCFAGLEGYRKTDVGASMTLLSRDGHAFFLANRGNAVNFVHGAEVRPFVHLVQAAMLHGIDAVLKGEARPGRVTALGRGRETSVAEAFERCFFGDDDEG